MDHFEQLKRQIFVLILSIFLLSNGLIIAIWWLFHSYGISPLATVAFTVVVALILAFPLVTIITNYVVEPIKYLWQAILYVSPNHVGGAAPNPDQAKLGRELVTNLTLQVYQLASQQAGNTRASHKSLSPAANIVDHIPLPLFAFNKEQLVTTANAKAIEYCGLDSAEIFGKPLYDAMDLEFPSERTLDTWIAECQEGKVTGEAYWERVRLRIKNQDKLRQCDIAASYNRDNSSGTEFIVTLYDRTDTYNQSDQELGFMALAVHELRTPLTMLRGYIEVFEDELAGKLNPEMQGFMQKMHVSAQQLTIFINNILNVARLENNQLALHLKEEKWDEALRKICEDLTLRAEMYGKKLDVTIAADLPAVGIDGVSMYEVVANLIENAIKYSGESKQINVTASIGRDGMIETSVQDFGVGVPASVLPNLFEKFYRNHRTKGQISGSGLGLYLCKAIVAAHGGNIWANSKEGEGSTFTFTLQPFDKLADAQKSGNNDITRSAHGWIKNHSLYRR